MAPPGGFTQYDMQTYVKCTPYFAQAQAMQDEQRRLQRVSKQLQSTLEELKQTQAEHEHETAK